MNAKMMFGVVITAVALSAGMDTAMAGGGKKLSPVGAWQVRVTPYNCASLVESTAAAFDSLLTFHANGTLTETTSNRAFQPGQPAWVSGTGKGRIATSSGPCSRRSCSTTA